MSDPYLTPVKLVSKTVTLVPLAVEHAPDLFDALAGDAELWAYLPSVMPQTVHDMQSWIDYSQNDLATQRIPYAVVLNQTGKAIGSTSYLFPSSANRTIEVGWTWYGRAYWRTSINTECKYALFSHAFETLKCMRVGLRADLRNERSQQAIERLGCVREGVLRKWQILPDGHQRNVVFFSMLDDEWPARKAWFQERLA
jgi:N-acetyltransferase